MADSINETNGIASVVPGEQKIRGSDQKTGDNLVATEDDFTLSPVITVTKKEASFSKGDLKLQKVAVTEDISDDALMTEDVNTGNVATAHSDDHRTAAATDAVNIINSETGEEVKKVSKIPRLRFRAAVNKIRREQRSDDNFKRKEVVTYINRRKSSIPRLKGDKTPPPKEETEKKRESINFDDLISNVTEADFDKIYEEIVEKPKPECDSTLENKDPTIVETKFDAIIQAYDANKIEPLKMDKSKSKIPLLKRKSEHDIEVKEVRKEVQRKGSLGRIPVSVSFGNKSTSPPKVKIPPSNTENLLSKQDTEATPSNHISNNDSETGNNNNVTYPIATATKIPLSVNNNFTKISSVVLNKQLIRVNSTENNKLKQTDEQTRKDENEDKNAVAEFLLPKLEAKSIIEAVTSEISPISSHFEDSMESKTATSMKNKLNAGDILHETDITIEDTAIDDHKTKNISISSERVFYNNAAKINEDTNIKPSQVSNTYYNETLTTDLKSPEPEIQHDKELEINNNDTTFFSKDYLIKEKKISPKINESEIFIKYKPSIREVDEVTKDYSYANNYNKNTNIDYENKSLNPNEPLIQMSKPIKYKTITASQTVEETNEEDIIILKGKVSRVISRLDSIEPNQKKKPLDDLPKQSVQSKISLFECNDIKPVVIKTIPSKSNLMHQKGDKPRVIEGILKESNKVDDLKELDKRKIFANLENNLPNDKVKIAYGLKDELTRWEKKNANDSPYSKIVDTEYGLEKNNANEPTTTNIKSRHNNKEIDKKENIATEDDVFAKKSAEIINCYKLIQQKKNIHLESDIKRAKSLAELDPGDAVTEKVKKIIYRIKSVDKIEHRKEIINTRERPRKGSVSEKIALFEGRVPKAAPLKMSLHEMINSAPSARDNSERKAELAAAAANYGTFKNISYVEMGGVRVPALWVGTAMVESGVTKELIKAAIDLGYRAFDTAYIYGTEREVGEAIREKVADGTVKREDLFVAGKLWSTFHRTDLVEQVCRESLEKLGLDYFDLYMIHNPMSFKEGGSPIPMIANVLQYSEHDYLDAWFGIEGVVMRGLARAAGVSNFNTKQIQRILEKGKIRPVVNQVESHPYLTQLGLESFCSAHNIRLSVFGSLGSKGTPAPFKSDLSPAIDDPLVVTMAAGLGITPAQLLISYQLTLGRAVVVKCSSGARLWENLQAQATPLRPEHVRALHNLNRNQRTFTFRGMGDTHKNYPFTELS